VDEIRDHIGYVYFIRSIDNGRIKIGHSYGTPDVRLSAFDIGSSSDLEKYGLMYGSYQDEASLKARFESIRVKGEWFHPHESLLAFIKENAKDWDELLESDSRDWMIGRVQMVPGSLMEQRHWARIKSTGLLKGSKVKRPYGRPKKVVAKRVIPARYGPLQALLDRLKSDESTGETNQ
jgi:hypothetical protein